jgi:hypothetical protein
MDKFKINVMASLSKKSNSSNPNVFISFSITDFLVELALHNGTHVWDKECKYCRRARFKTLFFACVLPLFSSSSVCIPLFGFTYPVFV